MNLDSKQNKILLKNCIVIQLKQLHITLEKQINQAAPLSEREDTQDRISYFTNLYELLKIDNLEMLLTTLNHSIEDEKFGSFCNMIQSASENEIAKKYMDITQSLLTENGIYSKEKFEDLKQAFFKGNEHLNPDNQSSTKEYEEEPETVHHADYSTEEMKTTLEELSSLFQKYNPKTINSSEFKTFARQFKELTLALGKLKFQQTFDDEKQGKKIQNMAISYDMSSSEKPTYRTDFTFTNALPLSIAEPASRFSSTYYQNLCYAYLKADRYSNMDADLLENLTTGIVSDKMSDLKECYQKLEDMTVKCKIKIAGQKIFSYDDESAVEPSKDLSEACSTTDKDYLQI